MSDQMVSPKAIKYDPRGANILNREERIFYLKHTKGARFVKINLLQQIEAMDADETIILNKEKKPPTLKEIILFALRQAHQDDQRTSLKDKKERYLVVKRVNAVDELELSDGEIKMILDRVGKMYLQVELVGKVAEILEVKLPSDSPVATGAPN